MRHSYFNINQVAEIFNTDEKTIRDLVCKKLLPRKVAKGDYIFDKLKIQSIIYNTKKMKNSVMFTGEETIEEVLSSLKYSVKNKMMDFIRYYDFYIVSIIIIMLGFWVIFKR
ncbi:hypothetical protein B9J78_04165 [bacterium Unc6]|nr:hypothetical protein [bacterium Unc6]